MPKLPPDHPAWELVRSYVEEYGGGTDYGSETLDTIPNSVKSPLSILVRFELRRLKLSYNSAGAKILRASAESHKPITSAGLYYLVAEAEGYTAHAATLEDLARGFEWDLDWLRQINGEDLAAGVESEARTIAMDLAANGELARLLKIARSLSPERLLAVRTFAEQLAAQPSPGQPKRNHDSAVVT